MDREIFEEEEEKEETAGTCCVVFETPTETFAEREREHREREKAEKGKGKGESFHPGKKQTKTNARTRSEKVATRVGGFVWLRQAWRGRRSRNRKIPDNSVNPSSRQKKTHLIVALDLFIRRGSSDVFEL